MGGKFAGLLPGRVRSSTMCSWHFPFFELVFKKSEIKTNWNNIFKKTTKKQQQKRSSSNNSWNFCSNSCFLFEKRAREAASLGASGHVHRDSFWCVEPLFSKPFSEAFFMKNDAKWRPKLPPKVKKTWSKTTLEMKSKKHPQNVLKLMPRDLWKTSFRMEGL